MSDDPDLDRIIRIAVNGLVRSREVGAEDEEEIGLHLDTFLIVGVWAWKDSDGDDNEGYTIWAETKRRYVQAGILLAGLGRLAEGDGHS